MSPLHVPMLARGKKGHLLHSASSENVGAFGGCQTHNEGGILGKPHFHRCDSAGT